MGDGTQPMPALRSIRFGARALLLLALAVSFTLLALAGTASAAGDPCAAGSGVPNVTRWTGTAGDNSWDTATNWDNGIPTSTVIACILLPGTYTVNAGIPGTASAQSLEIGGASGTQVLHVFGSPGGHHGLLALANQDATQGVNANGEIDLGETHSGQATEGNISVSAGTLTNRGKIVSLAVGSGPNSISGNFDNAGTLQLDESLNSTGTSVWTSSGTITIAATKTMALGWNASSSFTQTAGTITNNGTFDQTGGTFTASGNGTETGGPLLFDGGVTISPSGTGSGSFEVRSGGDTLGSDIGAGYALRVAGVPSAHHGNLIVAADRTNHGTIRLGSTDGTQGKITVQGAAKLTNAGTIISTSLNNNGANSIDGNLVNGGTLQIDETLISTGTSTWTSSGAITIAATKSMALGWNANSSFTQTAGTITNNGTFDQTSGTFTASGNGTETGGPLVFDGGVTISPSGTGSGTFESRSGGDTLGSDIGAGYVLRVGGVPSAHHGNLIVAADRTNHGTIRLGGGDSTQGTLSVASGQTLTNAGSIVSTFTGASFTNNGPNHLSGHIVGSGDITAADDSIDGTATLASSGTISVGSGSSLAASSLAQSGTVQIADGSSVTMSGTVTQTAGAINLVGAGSIIQASALLVQGGTLGGLGSVQAPVTNSGGIVSPGSASPGTLTLTGSFTQNAAGVLAARVRGSGSDRLSVGGAATLGGTLSIDSNGFTPTVGQTFTVLSDTSQSGQFTTVSGADSGPYDVAYDPTDVKLVASSKPATSGLTFSIDSPSLRNPGAGDDSLKYTVSLSAPSNTATTVQYSTANGTAESPADYSPASGTLTFAPGETTKTVGVTVHGLTSAAQDRTVFVNLTSPTNATIAKGQGKGTILNDRVELHSITPTSGGTGGSTTIELRGAGLTGSPTLTLVHAGQPDIVASGVTPGPGGRSLTATVDLGGAPIGPRDVVVTLPSFGASASLPGAFSVDPTVPPTLTARVIGPSAASNAYPWTGVLQVTNTGNSDATNALVRIDGFYSGSDLQILGAGFSMTAVDSGIQRDAVVAVKRVPGQSTASALVRFTPIGDAHGHYYLGASVLRSTAAATPAPDPTFSITRQVLTSTDTSETGVLHLSGASGSSDVNYDTTVSPTGIGAAPTLTRTVSGDQETVTIDADLPAPATGPTANAGLGGSRPPVALSYSHKRPTSSYRIRTLLKGGKTALDESLQLFDKLDGTYQLSISRKGVLDCLLTRRDITQADYTNLLNLASGAAATAVIDVAVDKVAGASPGSKALKYAFSFAPEFMSNTFEFQMSRAIRAQQQGDPNSSYFGMNGEDTIKRAYLNCLPDPPPPGVDTFDLEIRTPGDPNDKAGPQGFGPKHYVPADQPLPYDVMFENVPTASAPAHEVKITDQLDPAKVDLSTLSLGAVYFGDTVISAPPRLQSWHGTVDLRPAKDLIVSVDAGLDPDTGLLTWDIKNLDPGTGEFVTDPNRGFLPPDTQPPIGRGGVTFTVTPKAGLKTDDQISNAASIVFDGNAPIATPTFTNTIDATNPSSRIFSAKPRRGACRNLQVSYAGSDGGGGIRFLDVFASRNGAASKQWRYHTTKTSDVFHPVSGSTYGFYSVATDGVGHVQATTKRPDLKAKVVCKRKVCTVTSTSASWDAVVASAVQKGRVLTLRLRRAGLTSLQVRVNGRKRATARKGHVPAAIRLSKLPKGAYTVTLLAQTKSGPLTATRASSGCKLPATKKH